MPTLIAVMGHLTLSSISPYAVPGNNAAKFIDYAWGIYRDVDFASLGTALPAYSAGYSNSWMVHKTGTLAQPALDATAIGGQLGMVTIGANDIQYRRYDLNLRRYKRKLDSFNDTLVLSVENAQGSTADMQLNFYFRMLLLE